MHTGTLLVLIGVILAGLVGLLELLDVMKAHPYRYRAVCVCIAAAVVLVGVGILVGAPQLN